MVLVIGGVASGKRTYVRSLGYAEGQMASSWESTAPVLLRLEEALIDTEPDERALAQLAAKEVIVCREVGLGVVPLDPDERAWRERVGRTCTWLAARAERVVRMVCGIPVELKGDTAGRRTT